MPFAVLGEPTVVSGLYTTEDTDTYNDESENDIKDINDFDAAMMAAAAASGCSVSTLEDMVVDHEAEDTKATSRSDRTRQAPPAGSGLGLNWGLSGYPSSRVGAEALQREGLPDPDVVVILTREAQGDTAQDAILATSQELKGVYSQAEFVAIPEVTLPPALLLALRCAPLSAFSASLFSLWQDLVASIEEDPQSIQLATMEHVARILSRAPLKMIILGPYPLRRIDRIYRLLTLAWWLGCRCRSSTGNFLRVAGPGKGVACASSSLASCSCVSSPRLVCRLVFRFLSRVSRHQQRMDPEWDAIRSERTWRASRTRSCP